MDGRRPLPRFDRKFFDGREPFTTIGDGSIGGKASGLLAMRDALADRFDASRFPAADVSIPTLAVITTDFFEQFIAENALEPIARSGADDRAIALAFQQATLPVELIGDLRALIAAVHTPLAIRSSSLLEDAVDRPFAGVYATKMIPNNQPDADTRFRKLIEAVKFVYASTLFAEAQRYLQAAGRAPRDEKMAVMVQEVVGRRHRDRFYPDIAGVARSHSFYHVGRAQPGEGSVTLALGLGRTIVDDGIGWTYSPARPQVPPPFASVEQMLEGTQTEFWAVRMGSPPAYDPVNEIEYLVRLPLADAEADGTLAAVASTYDPARDRLVVGTSARGPRMLTFAPLLQVGPSPFNDAVRHVIDMCEEAFHGAVEIEFAVSLHERRSRIGFLQVRPLSVVASEVTVTDEDLSRDDVLVASNRVLGNGLDETMSDVVYVAPDAFDLANVRAIAAELRGLNQTLVDAGRRYVLIGFGRWGTTDPSLGIPVVWSDIAGAGAMVEAPAGMRRIDPSEGSHFLHNLASFRVSYFSAGTSGRPIAWGALNAAPLVRETAFVRHVRFPRPLTVKVDGRRGVGVIHLNTVEGRPA